MMSHVIEFGIVGFGLFCLFIRFVVNGMRLGWFTTRDYVQSSNLYMKGEALADEQVKKCMDAAEQYLAKKRAAKAVAQHDVQ